MTPRETPILVTGAHRSGTTWVGRVLCESKGLAYVHEPFNASLYPRLLGVRLGGHFTYVCEDNARLFSGPVESLLAYRIPVLSQLGEAPTPRDVARLGRDAARYGARRVRRPRPLWKDPIALFAAEWLADAFGFDVVVMIRHPAAFASSITRLEWDFDFGYWPDQPLLIRDYLGPLESEISAAADERPDRVGQAILLWRALYSVVAGLRDRHPGWCFLRQEDLAHDPVEGFRRAFAALALEFDAESAGRVRAYSDPSNVKEVAPGDKGGVRRDSRAAAWTWRHRLTGEEIDRVREETADVWPAFYDEDDWAPPDER